MAREQPIVKATIDAVNATYRAVVWRNAAGTAAGGKRKLAPKGSPDIIGFMYADGRMIGIEVKAPGARTAPERAEKQRAWQTRMKVAGCVCGTVTSPQEAVALVMGGRR